MFKKRSLLLLVVIVLLVSLTSCAGGMYMEADAYYSEGSGESYLELEEKGYIDASVNNKVNVSLDSSNAAYSNLRRMIKSGYNIDPNAVNIEQMLNYFNYSYVNNSDNVLNSFLELGECPWNEKSKLLSVAIKAKNYEINNNVRNNFVFLLDVSGSMYSEDKLPLMVNSFKILIDNLKDDDRISIVTYASGDAVLLDGGYGYEKTKISAIISDLEASGSTAGSRGIKTAYELAQKHYIEGGNNRVFLATDGDFNVGISSIDGLEEFISKKRETGVYLSLFGFGTGNLKSSTMDTLASAGNGNYYYIDSILEAQKVFISELGGTLRYKDVLDSSLDKEVVNVCQNITTDLSTDFIFASAVAEFGLLLRNSNYKGNASYDSILTRVNNDTYTTDIYKKEFCELVSIMLDRENLIVNKQKVEY